MNKPRTGPFSIGEARDMNTQGVMTAGCWRCIQDAETVPKGTHGETMIDPQARTQWASEALKFIGHRSFCPDHYRQEVRGAIDF